MQRRVKAGMRLLDIFTTYDTALEWQEDDPLLEDHVPPSSEQGPWGPSEQAS